MKICITSLEENLQSKVDVRFGRAEYFIFFNTETKTTETVKNPYTEGGGAGTKASQFMIDQEVDLIISGELGPNAKFAIQQAEIKFQKADLTKSVEANLNNVFN